MKERDPREGPKPSEQVKTQPPPGVEKNLDPPADHGAGSYEGADRLRGLSAVITGGDSGIGRAVAIAFAREGADVAFCYRSETEEEDAAETRRLIEEAGRRCLARRIDVGDPEDCRDFIDAVADEFDGLDILVSNAAEQSPKKSIAEITPEQLERTFRTNVFGAFYAVQAALKHMRPGGCILITGSVTGLKGHPILLDYASTKGALHVLTQSLAASLSEEGIRVNCVAPGPVWTPLINSTFDEEQVREFGKDTAWGRPAQPAELAATYVYLASAEAKFVTGEVVAVTGTVTTR
jgi:NAD(P)-dependent dehydrogenase (short-subunit alcohol dehydrogenase family)